MIHVLVVDDEPQLLRALVMNLSGRGYLVSSASTGQRALEQLFDGHPDLMVLDLGLPDMDGLDVISKTRERLPQLPIVVLSARTSSQDKVSALDLGASDYVTKPFDMNELVARLRATSRRANLVEPDLPIVLGEVSVNLGTRMIRRNASGSCDAIHLTPTEWRMLEVLLRRPGGLTTPTQLLTAMRGSAEHTERSYLRIYMQQHTTQTRNRSGPTPIPAHRTGARLPFPSLTGRSSLTQRFATGTATTFPAGIPRRLTVLPGRARVVTRHGGPSPIRTEDWPMPGGLCTRRRGRSRG